MPSDLEFVDFLQDSEWTDIKAMPVQTNPKVFLDVVFIGKNQSVAITGEALVDSDGNEQFSLMPYLFQPEGWWASDCDWKPVSLADTYHNLLYAPRKLQAFTCDQLQSTPETSLWSKIAKIRLCFGHGQEMTIRASYEYPCAIEIAFDCW